MKVVIWSSVVLFAAVASVQSRVLDSPVLDKLFAGVSKKDKFTGDSRLVR